MQKKFFYFISVFTLLMLVGCQNQEAKTDEPFIILYNHDRIVSENEEEVNRWLNNSKLDNTSQIYTYSMDGEDYYYFYAKGYIDVIVSYRMDLKSGYSNKVITANFKKGNPEDEVFIEVKYNPLFCCDGVVVNDSYVGE